MTVALPTLEPLELVSGMVFGRRRSPGPPVDDRVFSSPRDAFDALVLPALERTPCVVAYSGGRDSSAVLAAGVDTARRHGLELPVPVTLRFAGDARTDETTWQELVIRHLGLEDWQRIDLDHELDALGEVGRAAIERFGVYWPPLAHTWVPILAAARGGAALGGNGGDEFLSAWTFGGLRRVLERRSRPTIRDAKLAALVALPAPLRVRVWRRRLGLSLPWLAPDAEREVLRQWALESTAADRDWSRNVERMLESRYVELAQATFDAFARSAGVTLVEPLRHPAFVRAVARSAPRAGFGSRSEALAHLFGDLIPEQTVTRTTKAAFTNVPWGSEARRFAMEWDGAGVDPSLVDGDALRAQWLSDRPDFRTLTPLQTAWAATRT
jgi:asparagine synthase (glutamine-hydrolysing)